MSNETPMLRRRSTIFLALGVSSLIAILGVAWWLGFLTPEPDPVSITEAAATVVDEAEVDAEDQTQPAVEAEAATEEPASSIGSIEGEWKVIASDATFVGYRADSQVGEAVGRSPGVTGQLVATDDQITTVSIVADMTQLESDSSVRDGHLGDEGIEHNIYPTSIFELTDTIAIDAIPANGEAVSFSAVGDLTVKDITLPVTIDLEALVVDDKFIVAGDTEIDLDAYGASVSGTNEALMEFSVVFAR